MGIFVENLNKPFAGLNNVPTTLLETGAMIDPHTLIVNSILVTNKGTDVIRFSLQQVTTGDNPSTVLLANLEPIPSRGTINIVGEICSHISLTYTTTPDVSESLVGFSNGIVQLYDCVVTYTRLNETPLNF